LRRKTAFIHESLVFVHRALLDDRTYGLAPVDAIGVNLWTLAIVSVWRVLLITRVISVVYGFGFISTFFLVMLFADAVVFAVISQASTPVIDIMGGIRHTDRDALIANVTILVSFYSFITAPVWILGALIAGGVLKPNWPDHRAEEESGRSRGLLILAVVALASFVPLLIFSQPEQIHRREAELLLRQDRVPEALQVLSGRSRHDYPPHWNPPPRRGYREPVPNLDAVRDAMLTEWPSDWVAEIYIAKIDRQLRYDIARFWYRASWTEIVDMLNEYNELSWLDPSHIETAQFLLDHQQSLDESDRLALEQIVQSASPPD
jgi:hypothetical protein